MKWFLTGDMFGLASRLEEAGEEVVSTPDMYMQHDDDYELRDYSLRDYIKSVPEFDVLLLSNMNRKPYYYKKVALLWSSRSTGPYRMVIGGNENDPADYANSKNNMPGCAVNANHVSVYITNTLNSPVYRSLKNRQRFVIGSSDVRNLIQAVSDARLASPRGSGTVYDEY